MFAQLIQDPVVWGSLSGLGIVVGLCAYYLYLFMHNTNQNL